MEDRPTHFVKKIERYIGNKVVAHLLHTATIRGAIDLPGLWATYNLGVFTADEMREFYQLLGVPLTAYQSVFNETFYAELKNAKTSTRTTPKKIDRMVEESAASAKKQKATKAHAKPRATRDPEPSVDEDPERLAAARNRRKAQQQAEDEEEDE